MTTLTRRTALSAAMGLGAVAAGALAGTPAASAGPTITEASSE
ncbi:hypothetical protein OOZ51_19790 [Arthrobacter sp. MI7-26]|nr:hypothetical protein [Arthrobacter sp. MI7-26]MCX2750033.1 hypothetical protein [Arthrobacter sp. MI7-26]